jgi:hypothetical protein
MNRQLHTGLAWALTHMSGVLLQSAQQQRVGSSSVDSVGGRGGLHSVVEADDEGQRRRRHPAMQLTGNSEGAIPHHRRDARSAARWCRDEFPNTILLVGNHKFHASGPGLAGRRINLTPMSGNRVPGGVVHKLPADLREALLGDATALAAWKDITPLARNEFICWVEDAKQEATRARRIRRTREELEEGQRRPCCWPGCTHRERNGR